MYQSFHYSENPLYSILFILLYSISLADTIIISKCFADKALKNARAIDTAKMGGLRLRRSIISRYIDTVWHMMQTAPWILASEHKYHYDARGDTTVSELPKKAYKLDLKSSLSINRWSFSRINSTSWCLTHVSQLMYLGSYDKYVLVL